MPTNLNAGYTNNINTIEIRVNGSHQQRVTDRKIDLDGNGVKEQVLIVVTAGHAVGTPSAPGGKITQTVTKPDGIARSVVSQKTETDGGVTNSNTVTEFTEGA